MGFTLNISFGAVIGCAVLVCKENYTLSRIINFKCTRSKTGMQKVTSGNTKNNVCLIPKGRYFNYYKLARERKLS